EYTAQEREGGRTGKHAEHEHGTREPHLEQLQEGIRRHQLGTMACAKSATMSSAASIPTETRTVPGPTPSLARSSGVRPRCEVISGWEIVVSTPPRLAANETRWKRDIMP